MRSRLVSLIPLIVILGLVASEFLPARPSPAAAREEEGVEISRSAPADGITAEEILARTQEVYAGATSYEDMGIAREVFDSGWRQHDTELTFSTAFVRPGRFRFEYQEPDGTRYLIWSSGRDVRSWWTVEPKVERHVSLADALEAARGVSDATSWYIPALLLADRADGNVVSAFDVHKETPRRLPDGTLQGAAAFRVQGRLCDDPVTIWIDKRTYLVRRIEEHSVHKGEDPFEVTSTISYHPRIGHAVAGNKLVFDPSSGMDAVTR
jgi:outer membrane lipoprotein-sorting protein